MMKQITVNLYGIDELTQEAQKIAFEKDRYVNVEYNDWYDDILSDFQFLAEQLGVTIPISGIAFNGFYSQGDGSTFESNINLKQLIGGIATKVWQEHAPKLEFNFPANQCRKSVLNLLQNGIIEYQLCTEKTRGYWMKFTSEYYYNGSYPNIESELNKVDDWITKVMECLNRYLFETLRSQYDYLTSDEAIEEFFLANETLFTKDGKVADHLLELMEEL